MARDNRLGDAITLLEQGSRYPPDKNLFILYQLAIDLAGVGRPTEEGRSLSRANIDRRVTRSVQIAETGLRLFSARRDAAAIQRLLNSTGSTNGPSQRALANYLSSAYPAIGKKQQSLPPKPKLVGYAPLRVCGGCSPRLGKFRKHMA